MMVLQQVQYGRSHPFDGTRAAKIKATRKLAEMFAETLADLGSQGYVVGLPVWSVMEYYDAWPVVFWKVSAWKEADRGGVR